MINKRPSSRADKSLPIPAPLHSMLTTSLGVIEERDKITPTHAFLDCRRNQHWMRGAGVNLVNVSDDLLDGHLFITYRNRMGVFFIPAFKHPITQNYRTRCCRLWRSIPWHHLAFCFYKSFVHNLRYSPCVVSAHLQKPLFSEATFSTNLIIPPTVQWGE